MKDSKEKEHRISNLKNMINNVKDDGVDEASFDYEDIEEDSELIDYLNEDTVDYEDLEINDEFIYHPDADDSSAFNLEENPIDENFIIKTPKTEDGSENVKVEDELGDDITAEISENFDNVVNAKIGGKPVLAVVSSILGAIFIILSIFILDSRSDRVIDNVVSGETNFIFVIFFIIGLLLLIYGVYRAFNIKNPFEKMTSSINSIDSEDETTETKKEKPSQKAIPKSNIPLDKDSYKIGEFDMEDLKSSLKKPTTSKNKKTVQEDNDDIPPAKGKPAKKKGLTAEEIENMEYEQAKLESESIDDIFAEVEDIDDIPIISIDSKEEK